MNNPQIPPDTMARFAAAEARLYPTALTDVDGYQNLTMLIGLVAVKARNSCRTIPEVLARREPLISHLPEIAEAAGLRLQGLPADSVVDAGLALRCRELQASASAAALQERIDAARAVGDEWLIADTNPAEAMGGGFRRTELHLPTGSTLITSIEAEGQQTRTRYAMEFIPHGEDNANSGQTRVFPDRESWAAAVDTIRARLSADR